MKHARHPVHAPGATHVSDEIDHRRLHGGDHDRAAGIVDALDRNGIEVTARDKDDPDGAAHDRRPVPLQHHLEFLRAMMGRAVVLRGRQQPYIALSTSLWPARYHVTSFMTT